MRKEPTLSERILWDALRGNALGVKFRRQHVFGGFILDFFCAAAGLNVEIDGAGHFTLEGTHLDVLRDAWLAHFGVRVVRFRSREVLSDLPRVLGAIRATL